MTCPAKLKSGEVDQAAGMLSEDVQEQGYVLLCVAEPKTNECEIWCAIPTGDPVSVQYCSDFAITLHRQTSS